MHIVDLSEVPQHLQQLARWHQQEWAYLNPGLGLEGRIRKMQRYLQVSFVPSTFVAIEGQVVLGSAAIVECDMETHPELGPWLASVYVDSQQRKQGVGSSLVRHVMHAVQQHSIPRLYLFTPDQAAFYQDLGWQILVQETYQGTAVTIMFIDL